MGGGPDPTQVAAAQAQLKLSNTLSDVFGQQFKFQQAQQTKVNPFYTELMNQGLPYYSNLLDAAGGNTARAFAPAKAQLEGQLRQGGNALPSGFAQQARTDLAAQQARAFDQQLQAAPASQLQAREAGASGLLGQAQIANPASYAGISTQGYGSVMNAPLASPGLGGLLGGIAGGLMSAIPF